MHFHFALWERVWPFFRYFLGFVGISWGTPRFCWPILGQFWPFLTTFGPFLDHFWAGGKMGVFAETSQNPKNKARARVRENSIAPGGGSHAHGAGTIPKPEFGHDLIRS